MIMTMMMMVLMVLLVVVFRMMMIMVVVMVMLMVMMLLQGNVSLGQVTRSVCRGVVSNLASMMTPDMLRQGGIRRIVGSGACLIRNQVLQREIQEQYRTHVEFVEEGNACIGAAMAIADR